MRTLLILVDGMRPDAIANMPKAQKFIKKSTYTMTGQTVMPSATLPCHMSLFHSVDPSRHGTTTNIYAPQVKPIRGLCEVLHGAKKKCAFFYDWEALRDLSRPDSLAFAYMANGIELDWYKTGEMLTDAAIDFIKNNHVDFTFLYLGLPDIAGHHNGWMSEEYIKSVEMSMENIDRIVSTLPDDYSVVITADHGGHDRTHGHDVPEDMTIPIMFIGRDFKENHAIENVSIKDIAPTIAKLLSVEPDEVWEGKSVL